MSSPSPTAAASQSTLDLELARSRIAFSPAAINKLLNEGSRDAEMRAKINSIIASDPTFSKANRAYMSRSEKLANGLRLTKRLFELVDANDMDYMEFLEGLSTVDESIGLYLHEVAFQPVIAAQGSDEQQAYWLPLVQNHAILGCYAQTELGHGSNVSSLETIAVYDHAKKEFDLHSPTLSSTKWWIGGLGIMSTHSTVQARLIINGQDHGPHLFITQIRSLEDHSTMPGIEVGEIGSKAFGGMSAVDNGWARFNHVRLPLDRMLNRFASIDTAGHYVKAPHAKLSYGGMVFIRAQMIGSLAWSLAKSSTIAVRYLHVRRQFADPELKKGDHGFGVETQVISYPSVYMRVLPQVAKAIVFITVAKDMANLYHEMSAQLAGGDTTLLAETHAVSAGLKSYCSQHVVDSSEVLRRSLGGHGFLDAAGIGKIIARELPSVTYEGDNFILNLQVVRAALKTLAQYRSNPTASLSPSSAYFSSLSVPFSTISNSPDTWLEHSVLLHIISLRAALHVERLARLLDVQGKKFGDLSWECVGAAKAIVEAFLVRRMIVAIDDEREGLLCVGVGTEEKKTMRDLIHFYILYTLETALPDLLEFGIIAPAPHSASASVHLSSPVESLRRELNHLASKVILPASIGLVDGFGFSDFDLDTALGNYNGRPYETLLQKAKDDDVLNTGGPLARRTMYEESIRPILERGRRLVRESKM